MRLFYILPLLLLVQSARLGVHDHSTTMEPEGPTTLCLNCTWYSDDCIMGPWGEWDICTASACQGTFTHSRTRVPTQQGYGNGTLCSQYSSKDTQECNAQDPKQAAEIATYNVLHCPVDCQYSDWELSVPCSVNADTCGEWLDNPLQEGHEIWVRHITRNAEHNGAACPPTQELRRCTYPCTFNCVWGEWEIVPGECELRCKPDEGHGENRQKWRRYFLHPQVNGAPCVGESEKWEGVCDTLGYLPTCCPGCQDQPWSEWTTCSVSCGTGQQQRTRVVTQPDWGANPDQYCQNAIPQCGDPVQVRQCCQPECPVDCNCPIWSAWGPCVNSQTGLACGTGKRSRTRTCTQPLNGGKACPATKEEEDCSLPGCPTNCVVEQWSEWTPCPTDLCGTRKTSTRTRTVKTFPTNGGNNCPQLEEIRECPCPPCPVNCVVSPWGQWGACDSPCGEGTQSRKRDVLVAPRNGGASCPFPLVQDRDCIVNEQGGYFENGIWQPANKPCPIDCQMTQWSDWSECSRTCAEEVAGVIMTGTKYRTRSISVQAEHGGYACPKTKEYAWCSTQCCPVDLNVTDWGEWSQCSAPCGPGYRYKTRSVVTYAKCGGNTNLEDPDFIKYETCNLGCCDKPCAYYPFSPYSSCLRVEEAKLRALLIAKDYAGLATLATTNVAKCPLTDADKGKLFRYRFRGVRQDNCLHTCTQTYDYSACSIDCPVDCIVEEWSDWGPCDTQGRKCGWSNQQRTRITHEPVGYGSPCPCTNEVRPCDLGPCCTECEFTPWSDWTACSATCGGGIEERRRWVNVSSQTCDCSLAATIDTRPCGTNPCLEKCRMGEWGEWSACSSECGLGYQHRSRDIEYRGYGQCDWDWEEQPCNLGDCPVPCLYTEFTEWSPCPVTCVPIGHEGRFQQYRAKYRIQGDCAPVQSEERDCDPYPRVCYQVCQLGEWSDWGDCEPKYGWGIQIRSREVRKEPTGPEICPPTEDRQICYNPPPPVNCLFSDWGPWSECSATCKPSTGGSPVIQYRERWLLESPETEEGPQGSVILAQSEECNDFGLYDERECANIPTCPIDCVMTKWGDWTDCQWPGIRYRERRIKSDPFYGGSPCPACIKETDRCTMRENENLPGVCEVGPCLLEIQKEWEAKVEGVPSEQIVV